MSTLTLSLALVLAAGASSLAVADDEQDHSQSHHQHHSAHTAASGPSSGTPKDVRQLVKYPDLLRVHTLANMRYHLQTMGMIQEALAGGSFDTARELAENRLGMSSLRLHGAHEVAKYMPKGMQEAGTAMHRSASQFALVAQEASVTGDLRATLASLAKINQTCVACHAAYRLQ